jgi:hypothetical protein
LHVGFPSRFLSDLGRALIDHVAHTSPQMGTARLHIACSPRISSSFCFWFHKINSPRRTIKLSTKVSLLHIFIFLLTCQMINKIMETFNVDEDNKLVETFFAEQAMHVCPVFVFLFDVFHLLVSVSLRVVFAQHRR